MLESYMNQADMHLMQKTSTNLLRKMVINKHYKTNETLRLNINIQKIISNIAEGTILIFLGGKGQLLIRASLLHRIHRFVAYRQKR